MDGPSACRFLDWDSEFFGRRIASVVAPRPDDATLRSALDGCAQQRIDCLYFLAGTPDLTTAEFKVDHGFRPVDVRTTLEGGIGPLVEVDTRRVRAARPTDVPILRALAARSHTTSRFYADGRFDRARCDELYATWIEKSCKGWADAVFVAELEGRVVGYLSCHRREGGRGEIGLVAVDPVAQGRGLGRELVERALAWCRDQRLSRVTVVTQGTNEAAVRLYQSAGFRVSTGQIWYHKWFDEEGPAT